jgi:predicted nucleic acid-binding Zn ribbon protein
MPRTYKPKPPVTDRCVICKEPLPEGRRADMQACSDKCRQAQAYQRRRLIRLRN